jgi:hypothetical protein
MYVFSLKKTNHYNKKTQETFSRSFSLGKALGITRVRAFAKSGV